MRLLQKSLRFRNKLISFDRTVSSKVRKKLLKNEVKLRWSVWPQWIHGLCRLWKQTSPQRIPCGLHLFIVCDFFHKLPLCLSASHAGCIAPVRAFRVTFQNFASAHPMRVASPLARQEADHHRLCLSASHAGCIKSCHLDQSSPCGALPQRIPCGLHHFYNGYKIVTIVFASAHPMRVASVSWCCSGCGIGFASAHPMRVASFLQWLQDCNYCLCLSASHAGCILGKTSTVSERLCFASAHPMRVASVRRVPMLKIQNFASAHPMRVASLRDLARKRRSNLCLSASHAGCIRRAAHTVNG